MAIGALLLLAISSNHAEAAEPVDTAKFEECMTITQDSRIHCNKYLAKTVTPEEDTDKYLLPFLIYFIWF